MTGPVATAAQPAGGPEPAGTAPPRLPGRRDAAPLATALGVAVAGCVLLAVLDGSYLGSTITIGLGYAIVTTGMVLQLGYSRQLAFSQSVFMGVGAYGTGLLETRAGFSSAESLLAVIAIAAIAAVVTGSVVTRAPGLALALATLLLPLFVYQLATDSSWLGSFSGINGVLPLWNGATYQAELVRSGIVAVALLAAATALVLRIMRSGAGLQLMAMAADERLGQSIGVSLRQRRLEVFVVGSVLAAVGGAVLASTQGLVNPDVLSETTQITLLIMLFVPGRRSVIAAIIGAIVIQYLTTAASWISTNLPTIEGVVLIIVLLAEPDGVAGALSRLLGRRADRWGGPLRERAARLRAGGGWRRAGQSA